MTLTHVSLFSGIGGLDLAAEWAGFRTVGQVEYANYPFRVLRRRFGRLPRWRDVRDVTGEAIIERCGVPTLISGGFPCQPHSLAGKRLASCDERDLWGELARVVREVKPRWFVGENVAGLRSSESGRFFGRVLRDLAAMGYTVGWGSWEAADAGAPHHRERVFIVAYAGEQSGGSSDQATRALGTYLAAWGDALCGDLRQPPGGANTDLADTTGIRCKGSSERECSGTQEEGGVQKPISRGADVADADLSRSQGRISNILSERPGERVTRQSGSFPDAERLDANRRRYGASTICRVRSASPGLQDRERTVSNPSRKLLDGGGVAWHGRAEPANGRWWSVEPDVGRVAARVSARVERLKCLGNAVVPQQAFPIFQAIAAIERTCGRAS